MNELQLVYDLAIRASDVLVCIGALAFLGLVWMDDGLQKEYKMTNEQQRKMLEAAAKACGFKKWRVLTSGLFQVSNNENWNEAFAKWTGWNPLTNPADTAEMCVKLGIDVRWWWGSGEVECQCFFVKDITEFFAHRVSYKDHDNSRLKAWMYAATMVAAKIGGYTE